MAEQKLIAEIRTVKGKGAVRKLRQEDKVPGIYYHSGSDPVMVSCDSMDIFHMLNRPQGLVELELSDGRKELVVVKEYALDPVKDTVVHVDFMGVTRGEEFTVTVPVRLEGESAGVKLDGILEHLIHELEISVLPSKLPDAITIDVTDLEVGDSLQIKDIDSEDFTVLDDLEKTIVQVVLKRELEVEPEVEEVEGEEEIEGEEGAEAAEGEEGAEAAEGEEDKGKSSAEKTQKDE